MAEQDSVWKEIVYAYFEDFIKFFFFDIWKDIDFDKDYNFLDKELKRIVKDSKIRERYADILVKVLLRDGSEKWLLIHIEIQGYRDKGFEERMYVYNYRIYDRYHKDVVSLAILTDDIRDYRPNYFERKYWGFELIFRFPIIKIIDYRERWRELERNRNPFAKVVMAHLKEIETRGNIEERRFWKFTLIKNLYEEGYTKDEILNLYKFIDWLVRLPKEIEDQILDDISKIEEVKKMPYITTAERRGIEKGIEIGIKEGLIKGKEEALKEGIKLALEIKFGGEGLMFYNRYVDKMEGVDELEKIKEKIRTAKSVDELLGK